MHARPHFSLFGIPIRIEPLFLVVAVLLAANLQDAALVVTVVAVVTVSILVHELGHALTLKAFGQNASIVLHGFGGLTFSQRRLSPVRSVVVSLAGPFSALLVLGLPMLWLRESERGRAWQVDWFFDGGGFGLWPIVVYAAYVNIWWSIANLLPIRPLDGGNVLTEIVGLQPARLVSGVVGAGAAVWAYTHSEDFRIASFLAAFFAFTNLREWRMARTGRAAPSTFDIEAPPPPGGGGVRPGLPRGSSAPAHGSARPGQARGGFPTGPPRGPSPLTSGLEPAAAEAFAWRLLRDGDAAGAARTIARSTGPVSPFLTAVTEVAAGGSVTALVQAYADTPEGPTTLGVAAVVDAAGRTSDLVTALLDSGEAGVRSAHSIQTHLHYAERFASAAQVGVRLHPHSDQQAQVAFDTACAWSRAGDAPEALRWVGRAIDDGFGSARLLDREPDLDAARAHPDWPGLRARLGDGG